MKNGERRIVGTNLIRPASNAKVDVYFVVDATQSMDFAICAVQKDITSTAVSLAKAGLDVQFGLASFRDYPYQPWGDSSDYPYRQERVIAPLDLELLQQLHGIHAMGGSDPPESGQAALYQAISGEGQSIHPGSQSPGDIAPGQQGNFRSGALKLIIMTTDAAFVEPTPDNMSSDGSKLSYPGPQWSWVKSWMRKTGVKVASIVLGEDAQAPLTRAAQDSGALAPAGGADCGAGQHIFEGQPLVCDGTTYSSDPSMLSMGPAITGIVESLRNIQPLSYRVLGDTDILGVPTKVQETIDVNHDATVPYALSLKCDAHPGNKHLVIEAFLGSQPLATSTLDVTCEPKPEDQKFVVVALHGAAAVQAVQQPAPASNVNPQAAMGMVAQPEAQTAKQESFNDDENRRSMEMVATSRKRPNGIGFFAVGIVLISAGAAFGLSRKSQSALATASTRRRRR